MKPNFLIVGAAKSGTTSMFNYLSQHPDVFMPTWKEPSFFIGDPFKPLNRVASSDYYRLFQKVRGESAIGEASTAYLYDEAAPELIKAALGKIKIIIMLRNPVDMCYSLYNQQVRKEGENLTNFEKALEAEETRRKNPGFRKNCYGWHANYYYYHRGLYYEQVKRYLTSFSINNVLIILFDELIRDPVGITQKTYRFLGVNDAFVPVIKVHNPAGEILNLPKIWQNFTELRKLISFLLSKNILKKIPHVIRNMGKTYTEPINPATRQMLKQKFYDDICRLEQIIGKDLSAWKN